MGIYEASIRYQVKDIPLVVIAGQEYGTGSSRLGGEGDKAPQERSSRKL